MMMMNMNRAVPQMSRTTWAINESRALDSPGIHLTHGRRLRVGQVWRSNDPHCLRGVRIIELRNVTKIAFARDIVTGRKYVITFAEFTVGPGGWSLEK